MTNALLEAQAGTSTRIKPTYGFYRQPNGWLTVSPAADLDELKYLRRGWQALGRYGRVEMASEYAADHPFEALFIRGGAVEFCREQIIQSGFHLNPPLIPVCQQALSQNHPLHHPSCWNNAQHVVFPQITEADLIPYACRFCSNVHPTEAARDQHESVAHKTEKGEIRSGEALAMAMIKGLATTPIGSAAVAEVTLPVAPASDPNLLAALAALGVKLLPWQVAKLTGEPVVRAPAKPRAKKASRREPRRTKAKEAEAK